MLTLETSQTESNGLITAVIAGPQGRIRFNDLVWIVDRDDILDIYYWEAWGVMQGAYHCCFSIPGKIALLPP